MHGNNRRLCLERFELQWHSGSKGYYQFSNLRGGDYVVVVDSNQPALSGFVPTTGNQGSDRSKDSNDSPAPVNLPTNNSMDETIDFGYVAEPPPTLTCSASTGTVGVNYSSKLVASGGTSPYTFSATGLTNGLSLDKNTGLISGTPLMPGPVVYTATVVDARNNAAGTTSKSCTINIPYACTIAPTSINSDQVSWNKFNSQPGATVWIHAHIGTPSGLSAGVTTGDFTGVTFNLNGVTYKLPDGRLRFDPAATSYDGTRWTTTLPWQSQRRDLLRRSSGSGRQQYLRRRQGTFNFTTNSSSPSLAFSWQWSAAVYTSWPGNNAVNINPTHQGEHAGAPLNTQVQHTLIQGPRGGGGSNFTGSWSGTGHGSCPSSSSH